VCEGVDLKLRAFVNFALATNCDINAVADLSMANRPTGQEYIGRNPLKTKLV
jgi:hypothetical protein